MVVNSGEIEREMLERAAEQLADAGLSQAAAMACEAADDIPPKSEQNPFPEGTGDWRDWNRRELGDWTGFLFTEEERIAKGKGHGAH